MMMRLNLAALLIVSWMLSVGAVTLPAQELQEDAVEPTFPGNEALGNKAQPSRRPPSTNKVLWQQYQALRAGAPLSSCQSCGGAGGSDGSPYNRCGCNTEIFPWNDNPGNCDGWCVGPRWEIQANGLILFREDADLGRLTTFVGGTTSLVDQFDQGIGGRVFATGYNRSGYGLQVGWEGVDNWTSEVGFNPVGTETRTIGYKSRLNSVEINFLAQTPYAWNFFTGFRYVELAEGITDARINDKPIPAPIAVPAAPVSVLDTTISHRLKNRLIGFQVGARRDAWHIGNRLTFESFGNVGVYSNQFRRDDVTQTDTTIITGDDIDMPDNEFSQTTSTVRTTVRSSPTNVAFVGEAGLTSTLKITQCVALRAGYQVLLIDGVGQGLDAYFAPGLNSSTLVYHGLQFGVEYRR